MESDFIIGPSKSFNKFEMELPNKKEIINEDKFPVLSYLKSKLLNKRYSKEPTTDIKPLNIYEVAKIKPHIKKYSDKTYKPKQKMIYILESVAYKIFYIIITIYVLFAEDVKIILFDKSVDIGFSIVSILIMMIFLTEILIYFLVYDQDYMCGLFFWIDVMGLASMVLDIHWASDKMIDYFSNMNNKSVNGKFFNLTRLSRGIRIVTRAIRMIRILKLMKFFQSNKKISHYNQMEMMDEEEINPQEESKVGQKLEELTIRRMVILTLLMIFSVIFFSPTFYYNPKTEMDFGIQIFNDIPLHSPLFNFTFNVYINESLTTNIPMIYIKAYDLEWGNITEIDLIRPHEKIVVSDYCFNPGIKSKDCIAVFNNKVLLHFATLMNIIKTLFICIILAGGVICFSKDTNQLVLMPIAKMTKKIKNLSKNPIAAMQQNLNENEELEEKSTNKLAAFCNCKKKKVITLETDLLEKTISKISTLLALGFGEAGAEIISTNMQRGGDGYVDPMVAGKKVMAIYGFCDIRNFTDTTEVLQERVMIFVNEIAEIVHEITSLYCGSANKNIGDAFLLVWKFDEKFVTKNYNDLVLVKNKITSQIVDMALIAFLKILAAVQKSYKLNLYRSHPGLCERINNYSVKMGFGLHLGYSIEGAIGSMFKIDASYLSPNVNLASKLEEKTKEYKVQLILSDDFVSYLSDDAQKIVRLIDQIKSKEYPNLKLYTVDIDLEALPIDEVENEAGLKHEQDLSKKMEKIKINRQSRKNLYDDIVNGRIDVWKDFVQNDPDWSLMRKKFVPQFYEYYKTAVSSYIEGDWIKAREYFYHANDILDHKDGPTQNFISYMMKRNFTPDRNWSGYKDEDFEGH